MEKHTDTNDRHNLQNNEGGSLARPKRNMSHIQGWGADLDHANRPGYPMERMPPRLEGVHWHEPEQQPVNMEIFHSTERPGITPVFGTSVPPKGCSGRLRSWAYKFSENDIRRWLMLMFADRVDTAEGIGEDLRDGHVPNVFAEMGIKAEWEHNRAGLARKVAVGAVVAGAVYVLLSRRRNR
jgi:hypothetical protein